MNRLGVFVFSATAILFAFWTQGAGIRAEFALQALEPDGSFADWPETRPLRTPAGDLSAAHDCGFFYIGLRRTAAKTPELAFADGEKEFELRLTGDGAAIRRAGGGWVSPKNLVAAAKGENIEIAIPWKMLGYAAAPKRFTCTVRTASAQIAADIDFALPPPMKVAYSIPKSASVSLGVYAPDGKLLRHLARDEIRPGGENTESWDGLDQWGGLFKPGTYILKGIYHDPFKLDYLMSATSPGTPAWWTADGRGGWLSDEAPAQAVVTDGSIVYIAAPYAEAGHSLIAVGPDGKRIWGANLHGYCPRATALAILGDRIYVSYSGPELIEKVRRFKDGDTTARERVMLQCFDRRTGQLAGPSLGKKAHITVEAWPYRHDVRGLWDLRLKKAFSPRTYGGYQRYCDTGMCETTGSLGLAAVGDKLVVSLLYTGELLVLDAETLAVEKRIPVPEPAGLFGLDADTLLAVSGSRVVKVRLSDSRVEPVVATGLSAPFGVTADKNGAVYVSDWGDSFQVKKFSPKGRFVRAYGILGGRPWVGPFMSEGMQLPRGIAVTDDGKLWVAEDDFSPRRVSVWNVDSGKLIRDYIGPANYEGWGLVFDPADPTRIITCGTEFKLDLEKKTTVPVRKMFLRRSRADCFMPDGNEMAGSGSKIIHRGGKEFLVFNGRYGIRILRREGDEYRPVAAVRGFEAGGGSIDGTDKAVWDSDLQYHHLPNWYPEFFKGQQGNNHIWNDANGDGEAQESEVVFDKTLRRGDAFQPGRFGELTSSWCVGVGDDFCVYMRGFCRDASVIYRFDPVFGPDGSPRYAFDRCTPIVTQQDGQDHSVENLYMSGSGKLFTTYANNIPRNVIARDAFVCRDRDGKELWSIAGPKDNGPKSFYGYACADFKYPGIGSGVATWVWWHNCRVYLVTDDGLYLGGFFDNIDSSSGPEYIRPGAEVSCFAHQTPEGRLLLVNGYCSAHHIFEVKGLETARRFEKQFTVTVEDIAAAERFRTVGAEVLRLPPAVTAGFDRDTCPAELVTLRRSGRGADIGLRTDGTNLFVSADVRDETPMLNGGSNWQTPFISGDCVDIQLATDPFAEPGRRAPAPGDIRLILTEQRGEPLAVLYRPAVPGTKSPVQFLATMIDDVRRLPKNCSPVIVRTQGGYTLRAKIPLAELGFKTFPRDVLHGDVGVIYSDATGRDRDQRLYYYNKNTAIVSDLTTEASLAPNAWGPILFELPGNLVANGDFEADGEPTWKIGPQQNGAFVRLTDDDSFAGRRSLCLRQEQSQQVPSDPEKYVRDHGAFYRQFNGGKGTGFAVADWWVPVKGGESYDLRFAIRSENTMREQFGGRPGYSLLMILLAWTDENGKVIRNLERYYRLEADEAWRVVRNPRCSFSENPGTPITAPAGAAKVQIRAQLSVHYDLKTRFWIDQLEFAPTAGK